MKKTIQFLILGLSLLGAMLVQAQTVAVSGRVSDANGETLPGVAVAIKGTTIGTVTNIDGEYSLSKLSPGSVLQFSFVGMVPQEIEVGNQSIIDVTMEVDAIGIEEVVAVGYGTMKKSDLTGSVSSVKAEDLKAQPSTTIGQALQGKASGVLVRTTSAAPGGGTSIIIRGTNSINSDSDPLYIVDGMPLSSIGSIPVEDIESIEVLKDASSTAIYGARGANGVILVTTKRGKVSAKPEISYSTSLTIETIPTDLNLMNAEEFGTFYSEWELGTDASLDEADVWYNGSGYDRPDYKGYGEGTDWFDKITRTGIKQNHTITVNGGNERTTYSLSVNYLNHNGLITSGSYNRLSVKSSVTTKITDWMDTGLDLHLTRSKTYESGENTGMEGTTGLINQAIKMSPLLNVYTEDGEEYQQNNLPNSQTLENPVATAEEIEDYYRLNRAFGTLYLTVRPIKDLSVKFSVGTDVRNGKDYYYNPTTTIYGALSGGSASLTVTDNTYFISENIATYSKQIGNHKLNIVGGVTYEQNVYEKLGGSASDFISDVYLYNNLGQGSTYSVSSNKTKWSLASGLGRINYSWADRYLVTFTGRYDGSSRFGDGNKWGFFPSAALAWRISEESFMESLDWITLGKIRASYGTVGNQNIGLYGSQAYYSSADYSFGGSVISGVYASSLENNDLKWETTSTMDIGADIGLFNRFVLNFDYYYKKTTDLLLSTSLIETSGYASETMNSGELENKGWEFSVDARLIDKGIKWNASAGIYHNKNKILKLIDPTQDWKIGQSTGNQRHYVVDGIIHDQAELDAYSDLDGDPINGAQIGEYRVVDQDGDGELTTDDYRIIFRPDPDVTFTLNNNVSWKNLTFSMFLYGSIGGQILNTTKSYMTNMENVRGNYTKEILHINSNGEIVRNFWSENNEDNSNIKYAKVGSPNYMYNNIESGSYLRIQNIMLSYNLNFPGIKKFVSNASVYCSVQNLHTFTNYSGWDPDVSSTSSNTSYGIDKASYPVPRSYTFGLNVTF